MNLFLYDLEKQQMSEIANTTSSIVSKTLSDRKLHSYCHSCVFASEGTVAIYGNGFVAFIDLLKDYSTDKKFPFVKSKNLMYVSFLTKSELLMVEANWGLIASQFPEPYTRIKYATT